MRQWSKDFKKANNWLYYVLYSISIEFIPPALQYRTAPHRTAPHFTVCDRILKKYVRYIVRDIYRYIYRYILSRYKDRYINRYIKL